MTNDAEAGAGIVSTLRAEAGKGIVRMEDRYETEIEDLWSAVTDPSRLARWVAEVDGDLRVGGEFRARFTAAGTASGAWKSANLHGCCWLRSARGRTMRRLSRPDCSPTPTRRGW